MGQKVNPHGLRVGINAGWSSQWYADKKDFGAFLKEDNEIRKYIIITRGKNPTTAITPPITPSTRIADSTGDAFAKRLPTQP